ncbi:hypothetical protein GC176_21465 [bacterium]|nr:hypothetical protein [bacterium]
MSDTFDPYHKWLGIPRDEQPPNHYRLLGIAAFESDADVIDAAANQRMAYLQDMAVGPQVVHSQRLLNEISTARRCLLNTDAKATYDAQLRQHQVAQQPGSPPAAEAPFVPIINTDVPAATPAVDRTSTRQPASDRKRLDKSARQVAGNADETVSAVKLSPAWIAAFSSIGVLSVLIALFLIFGGKGGEQARTIGGKGSIAGSATFKVQWNLDERQAALMMIDGQEVFDSQKKFPDKTETLSFNVAPGEHDFYFERDGYRAIRYSYRFLPGESNRIALKWRR